MNSIGDMPPITAYGKYELIFEMLKSYAPVTITVASFFVILSVPFIMELFKQKGTADSTPPIPPQKPAKRVADDKKAEDRKILAEIELILNPTDAGQLPSDDELEKCRRLSSALKARSSQALVLSNIGSVYEKRGLVNRAEELLTESFKLQKKGGKALDVAILARHLSQFYENIKDKTKAIEYTRRAIIHFERAQATSDVDEMTHRIGNLKSGL